ncbi:MAG: DUF1566 domain-containing protein [Anaerolineales bacterium]
MKKRNLNTLLLVTLAGFLAAGCVALEIDPVAQSPELGAIPQEEPLVENPEQPGASPESVQTSQGELTSDPSSDQHAYPIVDTGQVDCYNANTSVSCPDEGDAFYGQDAQYSGNQPQYQDNNDGTITDLVTGLTWTQSPDLNGDGEINIEDKLTQAKADEMAENYSFAGHDDWRLPTIKELYSLIDFSGVTSSIPYIDTDYFEFGYGDTSAGERDIDAQFATTSIYVSTVMDNQTAMFGVNLADGRIKGYGLGVNPEHPEGKTFYVLFVRSNPDYGFNDFVDNQDGTITDQATGLTWMQSDNGEGVVWGDALSYCADLEYAGISDWRLPNAKELQSIVDYSRSPDTTQSAAIDPLFQVTYLPDGINDTGVGNYPFFWTSTTHLDGRDTGSRAVYVSFGEARGIMNGRLMDVHGAGAQRSDPKSGDPSQFAGGLGPQGDIIGIYNYARCVTGASEITVQAGDASSDQQLEEQQPAQPQQGQSLPQEAVDACTDLSQGVICSFEAPQGTISGQCAITPTEQLACVPEGSPPLGDKP